MIYANTLCMMVSVSIDINFLLIEQIPRGEMFFKVRLNLIILFQSGILPQIQVNSRRLKKKSLPDSGSISVQNFGFFVAKWILLGARNILPPLVSDPRGCCPPGSPKIDAYVSIDNFLSKQSSVCSVMI